jgi:membrane-associated phospholipid phosphatase
MASHSWRSAALWASGLGALFLLVYGGTNWITSWRTDVGTLYFTWERRIPFVPILIIPYMSIDLFFIGAFFLCTSSRHLHSLAKRVIFAILLSGVGFLLLPLQFAFERPPVTGFLGATFGLLSVFDRPYNLVPSLHIALLAIIRPVYRRRTRRWLWAAMEAWFLLIAVSTVLTYQHHVVDVITGGAVAVLAFLLFPDRGFQIHVMRHNPDRNRQRTRAVGMRYGLGAVVLSLLAYAAWPWSAILVWPAIALAVVSLAYFGCGPRIFWKSGGVIPLWMRMILGPYQLGTALCHRRYRRSPAAYAEVVPGLLIGRRLNDAEARTLIHAGVRAVLDLTCEMSESKALRSVNYDNVQILDLTAPSPSQLAEAVRFLRDHRRSGPLYIHCALGYSRTACVAAAYLLAAGIATSAHVAIRMVRKARPEIVLPEGSVQALQRFSTLWAGCGETVPPGRPKRVITGKPSSRHVAFSRGGEADRAGARRNRHRLPGWQFVGVVES